MFFCFLCAQLVEVVSRFYKLDNNKIIFNSTGNNKFTFNSKYLFEYFLNRGRNEYTLLFVINNRELRKKLTRKYGNHFISTNSFAGMWHAASAKLWVTSVLETPYVPLFFIKNKKRIVYHVGHGVPLKKIGLAEELMSPLQKLNRYLRTRLFTHVICYSNDFKPIMEDAFRNKNTIYVCLGQPRNDKLKDFSADKISDSINDFYPDLDKSFKKILYAPTWRSYSKTQFFPFDSMSASELNRHLITNNYYLFLREHHSLLSVINEEYLMQSNILLLNSDNFPEIMDYLPFFDKLITDYSSIYLDFLCLDKPVAFIPYDIDVYSERTGFTMPYNQVTPGLHLNNKSDFYNFISLVDDNFSDKRKAVSLLVNSKPNDNSKESYEFISNLLNGVS